MKIRDWIDIMARHGTVCGDYMRKITAASSNEDIFRILCDANGGQWLFEQHANGIPLPIEEFCREFKAFVNGGWVMEYPSGYTSKFYCCHFGDILADTTLVYLLECRAQVIVPKNAYPSLILSKGSIADITMLEGSRLNIEAYGDARWSISGDQTRVRVTHH